MTKRAPQGSGTIRKKSVTRAGKTHEYWEARVTVGRDPGTGRQIQRSFTGKTQKDVLEKMQAAAVEVNDGTYTAPTKMTVSQWLDIWTAEYLGGVKPATAFLYREQARLHIKPALGAVHLEALDAHTIQRFYNGLARKGLAPKSFKNIHGILHKALQQAVSIGYLRFNPSDACTIPRAVKRELAPLDEEQIKAFLDAIKGHRHEVLYQVALFTGLREGELLGLQWDAVNFKAGTITVKRQLQRERKKGGQYYMTDPKSGKSRTLSPAPWVMSLLHTHQRTQNEQRLKVGALWEDKNLVFPNETGGYLSYRTVYDCYKRIVAAIGRPDARFHDLRHSYAVNAIRAGDDIKTLQESLGHATAAFTLDIYGHVTEEMKQASAQRMEGFIHGILNL